MIMNAQSSASGSGATNMVGKENSKPLGSSLRRRRSKGTIAGYASGGAASENGVSGSSADLLSDGDAELAADPGAAGGGSHKPQHVSDSMHGGSSGTTGPAQSQARPCYSAKMALLCAQNAIYMGARTQLALCPPGRARRKLAVRLRERRERDRDAGSGGRSSQTGLSSSVHSSIQRGRLGRVTSSSMSVSSSTVRFLAEDGVNIERILGEEGMRSYDGAEEECISNPEYYDREVNSDGEELIEDPSSGDDDELDVDGDEGRIPRLNDGLSSRHRPREPLYTPSGVDAAGTAQNANNLVGGSAATGKLPFNQRKLRWFDSLAASDRAVARQYIRSELLKLRKRDGAVLVKHLQMMQRRERRLMEAGKESNDTLSDEEEDDAVMALEQTAMGMGITSLPDNMTPSLSAALVLESLSLNQLESIEGMSKCYDAIVAAGVAILDSELDASSAAPSNAATPTAAAVATSSSPTAAAARKKPTKSEIMTALAPVLITTLEQPSGEAILALANLRRMCGTRRYQRRFVQRVAPSLIRPPNGAIWCLRHQNDMEAILAAAEMLFDMAHDIFSAGWHERGRQILADSVRADALRAAAEQLKSLSSPESSDSLITGLSSTRSHGRSNTLKKGTSTMKEGVEPLAEWEVLAVDVEIRSSINNLFSKDWSRQIVTSNSIPRDDVSVGSYRHRRGISSGKPKPIEGERPAEISSSSLVPTSSSGLLQPPPSPIASSLSPRAHHKAPLPLSPASGMQPSSISSNHVQPNSDALESVFGPSFAPPPTEIPAAPGSPSGRRPVRSFPGEVSGSFEEPHTPTQSQQVGTPPRSPISDRMKADQGVDGTMTSAPSLPSMSTSDPLSAPLTPSRMTHIQTSGLGPAPLSPMSVGNASYSSMDSNRITSGASVSSSVAGSQTAHQSAQTAYLRTLTSTAAERKRTVAACRALRAQISRFEEAFIQLHGRPPKGAAERAPLATTYAQYREWKRAIRADAACRIQALFRGARVRWMLLRSNDPRLSRVVLTRAGRPEFTANAQKDMSEAVENDAMVPSGRGSQNHVLNKISIPVEIGGGHTNDLAARILMQKASAASPHAMVGDDVGPRDPEGVIAPVQANSSALAPNWSDEPPNISMVKRTAPREDESGGGRMYSSNASSGPSHSSSGRSPVSNLTFGGVHMNDLPLQDLQARKRELKQQLKQYDMNFAKIHGRMPVKAEKEPIRHLYESYNALKARISYLEREGVNASGPPVPYRRSSADRSSLAHSSAGSVGSATSDASGSGDEGPMDFRESVRSAKRNEMPTSGGGGPSAAGGAASPAGASSQDLAALKAEKGQLHQMLRSYEKDFYKLHNRQVSSFADIRPVASQYRRYKEIKKAISAIQQGGG